MAALRWAAALALAALAQVAPLATARAEQLALDAVPRPLAEWTDWVLRGHEEQRCPFLSRPPGPEPLDRAAAQRHCAWPSQLELELGAKSGRFAQRWQIFARSRVPLPGGENRWPLDVQVDGRPAPVVVHGAQPSVELEPGIHRVSGAFAWDALPETLAIPPETALVSLTLNGREVALPDRDEPGRLWLERRSAPDGGEANRLEIDVHRRVIDEIPLQLDTRIELRVAGRSREALLGNALPAGFVPMSLDGALPARLDPDGRLRVQLRPGNWTLSLQARQLERAESLAPPAQPAPAREDGDAQWDAEEIWVFDARPQLRSVELSGAPPVDPNQTNLPAEWRQLPAFLMQPGSALQLAEKRRGDADPAPDDLALERSLWLDFDGRGFTLSDRITGVVRRSARLEMRDPIALGRASLDGNDQFITRVAGGAGAGIEIPLGPIDLSADSRADERSALTAVGWDHEFQQLGAQLWLPPGWRLIHASGVDRATATWLNRWTLLDLFVVLISAMGVYRLWGTRWGVVAIAALAIGYTEPNAPRWLWVAALVGEALRRALPSGRLSRLVAWYRAGALGLLVLAFVSFGVEQLRVALHPVLEHAGRELMSGYRADRADKIEEIVTQAESSHSADSPRSIVGFEATDSLRDQAASPPPEMPMRALGYASPRSKGYRPDPNARVTTGPGLPTWTWNRVELAWSGPVRADQTLSLVLMPPWLTSAFGFARVAALAALLLCMLGALSGGGRAPSFSGWLRARGGASAAVVALPIAVLIAALATIGAAPASADFPSKELLDELRAALLEAPECAPQCAAIPRLRLDAERASLTLRVEIDAAADTAVPLPGGARSWDPA
ncbi:MAG TPA: hypothetical protein VEC18_12015, partial [Myxococcota bacterium]|nr:hypothetical protein [Myxococcota bacterium]